MALREVDSPPQGGRRVHVPAPEPEDKEANEATAIEYVLLNLAPMERGVGAARNHLPEIGDFHGV